MAEGDFPAADLKQGQVVQYQSRSAGVVTTTFEAWNEDGTARLMAKHEADADKITVEGKHLYWPAQMLEEVVGSLVSREKGQPDTQYADTVLTYFGSTGGASGFLEKMVESWNERG